MQTQFSSKPFNVTDVMYEKVVVKNRELNNHKVNTRKCSACGESKAIWSFFPGEDICTPCKYPKATCPNKGFDPTKKKTCTKCKEFKLLCDFMWRKDRNNWNPHCRACDALEHRQKRAKLSYGHKVNFKGSDKFAKSERPPSEAA